MTTSPKCRAQGGPANCTDPNCPERQAFINELHSANTGKYDRKFLERHSSETPVVDTMQLSETKPSFRELLDDPNALVAAANVDAVASVARDKEFATKFSLAKRKIAIALDDGAPALPDYSDPQVQAAFRAKAAADVEASQVRRVRRAARTRPTLDSPSERVAFNSLKKGDYVSLDDHGNLTKPVKVIKVEKNDGYNVKITWQSSDGSMVLSTMQWYTTPITRYTV